jgi:glyoxylase-like metal-dependent hydrolase (beta-lactamase superfamily II)
VTKLNPPAEIYLGTTHFHPEHDLGAYGFPASAKMVRSEDQKKDIAEFGLQMAQNFSKISPLVAELLNGAEFRPADISFETEHTIDLGGVTVKVIAMGPNHTRGDTAFFVQPDGVLLSGDVVMRGQPAFASPYSSVSHWLTSLDKFDKLSPKKLVPSHGPMGGPELIAGYRTYLTTIQKRAGELKAEGKTADEAVQTITTELHGTYPDKNRIGGAVRTAYKEAK